MSTRYLIAALLAVLCTAAAAEDPARASLSADGGTLQYEGPLALDTIRQLELLYQQSTVKPRELQINSPGGDARLGMYLGYLVHGWGLDVRVREQCASSCANYVFPAGREKYLEDGSMLLWHGGALQPDWQAIIRARWPHEPARQQAARDDIKLWQQQEQTFYGSIGVSQLITVCGQHEQWRKAVPQSVGFDYSPEDLARFGIRGLHLPPGGWQPHQRWNSPAFFRAAWCDKPPAPVDEVLCGCKFDQDPPGASAPAAATPSPTSP
ncbi:hypothetical protein [Vogesella sp. LIG4]|uniref:hypothetical protein n=1 Tax=Vogesella sp. LIG4 TaxID=1192162 RepID=UPI00081FADCA|nr:hypothetical protein [Vogesella sp. LIG4]SCK06458.1 hypothetical protein PSELUDRAFT_0248 [Vogesella sp. LIG4]